MNPYVLQFRGSPASVRVNAVRKVGFARGALNFHRANGFGPEDDDAIVRQFDLAGMAEFWEVTLSEPMECEDFAHALAVHFMVIEHRAGGTDADRLASGPAASRAVNVVRAQLRSALRRARLDGEPWFNEMPEPPPSTKLDAKAWLGFVPSDTVIVPPPPPADGVDLSRLKVRSRPAVEWLMAMPKRRHLVPASLAAYLATSAQVDVKSAVEPPRAAAVSDKSQVSASAPKQSVDRGGRPKVYDWGRAGGFISGYIDEHDPQTEADLRRALTEWFTDQGKAPDEREVSRFVKEAWKTKRN